MITSRSIRFALLVPLAALFALAVAPACSSTKHETRCEDTCTNDEDCIDGHTCQSVSDRKQCLPLTCGSCPSGTACVYDGPSNGACTYESCKFTSTQ